MIIVVIGLVFVLIMMLLTIYWLFKERTDCRETLNSVLSRLDMAISGTQQSVPYDESIDAAITEKLNQLVIISKRNYEHADRDKTLVQSLISDISHQVRTPLTNIMLYAGILQENGQSEENHKMAVQIQRQSEKLDFFMKELSRSSYLETEMISVHMIISDIDELIAQACQEVELTALKKKIIFEVQECHKSGMLDPKWTKEALVNVLDNAIKYSPVNSVVSISCFFYENFFCIQIGDQGIGIEEQEQGAIFKRFYRSPNALKEQGLGIGLYLVREIMDKQNGYVKVKSAIGEGSIFCLFLPNH